MLPPYDEYTTELEDAYPLEQLVPKNLKKCLDEYYEIVMTASNDNNNINENYQTKFEVNFKQQLSSCHIETQKVIKNLLLVWEQFLLSKSMYSDFLLTLLHNIFLTSISNGEKLHKKTNHIKKIKERICIVILLNYFIRFYICMMSSNSGGGHSRGGRIISQTEIMSFLQTNIQLTCPDSIFKFLVVGYSHIKKKMAGETSYALDNLRK